MTEGMIRIQNMSNAKVQSDDRDAKGKPQSKCEESQKATRNVEK